MHKDWLKAVEENARTLLVGPRGHAKSSVMSLAYPCYYIGKNPGARIKVISCSDDRAYAIVFAIYRCLRTSEKFHEVFPEVVLESKRPSRSLFVRRPDKYRFLKDPTLESFGVQASAEGTRATLLILDDIISQKNSRTPGLRNMVREQFYNVHINLLEPTDSKVVYIGSVWDEDDLTVHLMQKGEDWHKCIYRIDEDFTPLWPQVWSKEKLIARCNEIGLSRFNLGFRNFPGSKQSYLVSEELYSQAVDKTLSLGTLETVALENIMSGRWRVSIGVDLSALAPESLASSWTKRYNRGYNVIYVLAVDTKTSIRIPIDIIRIQTATAPEFLRLLAQKVSHYRADVVMVESNAYQQTLVEWMKELYKPLIPLVKSVYTTININDLDIGINSFKTEFETRMWRLPEVNHPVTCDCGWCSFRTEITSYPFYKRRDVLLAAYQAKEGLRRHIIPSQVGGFVLWET